MIGRRSSAKYTASAVPGVSKTDGKLITGASFWLRLHLTNFSWFSIWSAGLIVLAG